MINVLVLSGKRGGFGAMRPLLNLLKDSTRFNLSLVLTDQHASRIFGNTRREVERDFHVAAVLDMEQISDRGVCRTIALSRLMRLLAEAWEEIAPDLCILYGDRGEVLVAAQVATLLGTPILHLQGGDRSGSVDEQVRHAISKLSHYHGVSTLDSANRLLNLGEENWRIRVVGDNHVDEIVHGKITDINVIKHRFNISTQKPLVLLLQHSETTAPNLSYEQMSITLHALSKYDTQIVAIYPCSDVGYEGILRALSSWKEKLNIKIFKNLDAEDFRGLMRCAEFMIGNSSAGIIEARYFDLPVVNIGRRQNRRLAPRNVISVKNDLDDVCRGIDIVLNDKSFKARFVNDQYIYGDGSCAQKIFNWMSVMDLSPAILVKEITY